MPLLIDYSSRGPHLFPVIFRMAAEGGCESLSVRRVSAGFELSPGALRHQFPSQGELLRLTMKKLALARQRRLDSVPLPADPVGKLRAWCVGAIPQDEGALIEAKAWLAFEERSRHDPDMAVIAAHTRGLVLEDCQHWLRCAGVAADDLAAEARRLRAVIDGLTSQVCDAVEPLEPNAAINVLERDLSRYGASVDQGSVDQGRGDRGDAFAPAGEPEAVGGGRTERDPGAERR